MGRISIKNQVSSIKAEISALLNQIFGVATNNAPTIVNDVFQNSKDRIQASLDYKQTLDPQFTNYLNSLNIPDNLKGIDSQSALDLVKNDGVDFKNFSPILKSNLSNNSIKSLLSSGMPGTGGVLSELSHTLSGITGRSQLIPSFAKDFLSSSGRSLLDPEAGVQALDPTFTSLESATRSFIASSDFALQPTSLLNLVSSGTNLPADLAQGLLENQTNPAPFVNNYIKSKDLSSLDPIIITALTSGGLAAASPQMISFLASSMPGVSSSVRSVIGAGQLSSSNSDIIDFLSHSNLNLLSIADRSSISSILSVPALDNGVIGTVGKMISNKVNITDFITAAKVSGIQNLNLSQYGLDGFSVSELQNFTNSSLDLNKFSLQLNKLNLSQLDNVHLGSLISQGATTGDINKLGNLLNSGFGNKLPGLIDLISAGKLGNSIPSLTNSVNQLKSSFLGLTILGQVASIGQVDNIVKEIIKIVPIGDQNLNNLLARIGPEINTQTQNTLAQKGDRSNEITDLIQRKFARDFQARGPAGRNRPQDDRSTNNQYVPQPTMPSNPPISSITDGPVPPSQSNNI